MRTSKDRLTLHAGSSSSSSPKGLADARPHPQIPPTRHFVSSGKFVVTAQVQWVAAELLDFPVRWPVCAKFAAGLLTNILYTGAIRHKGQAYPASTPPFLNHGTWERVQNLIAHPAAVAPGKPRNKHLALLSGLLYYESCSARMVYSYSGKGGRQYPYYVCLNAQRKGWAACPVKSLSARAIEESVLEQIRQTQPGSFDPSGWGQMDRIRQVDAVQAVVERV